MNKKIQLYTFLKPTDVIIDIDIQTKQLEKYENKRKFDNRIVVLIITSVLLHQLKRYWKIKVAY